MKLSHKWKLILFATIALSLFTITACSSSGSEQGNASTPNASTPEANTSTGPQDPLGKYPETVTVTQVIGYNPPEDPNTPSGITPEKNAYLKSLKDMLNIEVKYKWMVPASQYEQKFSLALASGDLPDIIELSPRNFEKLRNQDMLADLTAAYEQYASPTLKKYMESDGGQAMKAFSSDGKILGIPAFGDTAQSTQILWVRKDWLDNLNLQPPTTMEELDKVATAFANDDPDKNGKDDTYGVVMQKNIFYWGFDLRGFFNGFNAYPSVADGSSAWIKDSQGKLIPGLIQPEVKTGLEMLQSWYQKGVLDKEFALKDENKAVEDLTSGKVGISYGEWWNAGWPLNLNVDKDPKAEWIAIQIPGIDGPAKSLNPKLSVSYIYAVNKECKNPEAAIKMMNFFIEMGTKQYMEENTVAKGYVYNWFTPRIYNPVEINTIYEEVNKALDAKQTEITLDDGNYKNVAAAFNAATDYLSGETSTSSKGQNWGTYYSRAAKDGSWALTRKIKEEQAYVSNEFYGVPTPTQVERGAQLDKLMQETFTKIIMGAPISDFDKFVTSWKSLGGDKVTQEINDWYTKESSK